MIHAPNVRHATPADMPGVTAIYRPAVLHGTATFELDPPDEAEMGRRYAAITGAGYPYLVAELDGRIAGFAYVNVYRTRPAYRATVEDSIYIAEDVQRRGIGTALMTRLILEAEARGYRQIIAVIGDSQQLGSIGLHRACGFTFCGVLHAVGFKHGRWLDSVFMQRALGAADITPL
jgi:L-amino acid N-acyltransferase YncA